MRKKVEKKRTQVATACMVLFALLFSACAADGWQGEMNAGEPVLVRMDASLDAESMGETPQGRAATNTSLAIDGRVVKLFLIGASATGTKYANRYAVPYTYSAAATAWQATAPLYVDARKAHVYACYDPYSNVGFGTSTVTASDLTVQANNDRKLWYYDSSNTNINNANARLSFLLRCAYSRLTLTLSRTSDYPNACKVSKVTMRPSIGSFYTTAKVDIGNAALSGTTTSQYVHVTTSLAMYTRGLTTSGDSSIDLLFPAQKLASGAGLTFVLTVDGKDYSVTVPTAKFNEFKRGVRHVANLRMSGTGVLVNSVTTTDWPAVTNTNVDASFD